MKQEYNKLLILAKKLREFHIDRIYSSPIERAKHTLELFDLDKNIPIIIDDKIKEKNMGIYEKVKFKELDRDAFWKYDSEKNIKTLNL